MAKRFIRRPSTRCKRIDDEDSGVIEEEEQFTELASNEVLLQQLRAFLDGGGREAIDSIPDGIHSGLQRPGVKGVFFYFRSQEGGSKQQSFWKYYDLKTSNILDNRHVLANLIACAHDTPRIVDQEIYKSIFEIQEKVLGNLLQGQEEKAALQVAPQAIDPLQQTVATIIQSFLNHPEVDRKRAIAGISFLNGPMQNVQVAELRKIYKLYQQTKSVYRIDCGNRGDALSVWRGCKSCIREGGCSCPSASKRGPAADLLRCADKRLGKAGNWGDK